MRRIPGLTIVAVVFLMLGCSSNGNKPNNQAVGDTGNVQQQLKDLQATIAALQARTPPAAQVVVAPSSTIVAPGSSVAPPATLAPVATNVRLPSPIVARTTAQAASPVQPLQITAKGYGLDSNGLLQYAFLVQNPNSALGFSLSTYQVAIYDTAGTVLKTDSGYLHYIYPSQTIGLSGVMDPGKGVQIDHMDVQLKPGTSKSDGTMPALAASKVTYQQGQYSIASVTGVVSNSLDQDADNVEAYAVAYDSNGAIIGGGNTILSFVPAGGQAAAEVRVITTGTPTKVELYLTPTT